MVVPIAQFNLIHGEVGVDGRQVVEVDQIRLQLGRLGAAREARAGEDHHARDSVVRHQHTKALAAYQPRRSQQHD